MTSTATFRDTLNRLYAGEIQLSSGFSMQNDSTGRPLLELMNDVANFAVANIKYKQFAGGATGDGTGLRDQLAFDAAHAYVASVGAGVILIPPGLYIMATAILNPNIVIFGMGSGVTKVRQRAVTGRDVYDASSTAGSPFVDSATAAFTTADEGKNVLMWYYEYTGSFAGYYSWAPHIKRVISPTRAEMHDVAPPGTTYGPFIHLTIGVPFNMLEVNPVWHGNLAVPINNCGAGGIDFDGNKANVPTTTIDIIAHNVILTNASYFYAYDLITRNAHNAGYAQVINSNYCNVSGLTSIDCGNFVSIPSIDINSSKFSTWVNIMIQGGAHGWRMIDFCWGNVLSMMAHRCGGKGLILNGSNGACKNNDVTAVVGECAQEGIQVGMNYYDNMFRFTAEWTGGTLSGHTFVPDTPGALVAGVLFGHPGIPDQFASRGNAAIIKSSNNTGAGLELATDNNRIQYVGSNNSLGSVLGTYGLIITGRKNTVYVAQYDDKYEAEELAVPGSGVGQQRNTVIRPPDPLIADPANLPGGEFNTIFIEASTPISECDDQSVGQSNYIWRNKEGVRLRPETAGPLFLVGGVDVGTQIIDSPLTNVMSVNCTGGIKNDRFHIVRAALGLYALFITNEFGTIVAVIPEGMTGHCDMVNYGGGWMVEAVTIDRYNEGVTVLASTTGPILWAPFADNEVIVIENALTGTMSFKPTLIGREGERVRVRRAGVGPYDLVVQDETSTTVATLKGPGSVDFMADAAGHWVCTNVSRDNPVFAASSTAAASYHVPAGTAPTSPVDGDHWSTTAGDFYKEGGVVYGPLGFEGSVGTNATTTGPVSWNPATDAETLIFTNALTAGMSVKPTTTGRPGQRVRFRRAALGNFTLIVQNEASATLFTMPANKACTVDLKANASGSWVLTLVAFDDPSGTPVFVTSTATVPSATVPAGVAVTAPVDSDMYVTSGGIFHKSGGVLRGPFNAPAIVVADWTSSALAANTTNLVGRLGSSANQWLCAPGNGRVVNFTQLVAKVSGAITAGSLTLTVKVNGVATGLTLTMSSGSTGVTVVALGTVLVGQLDEITIERATSSGFAPAGTLYLDCSLHGVVTG